MLHFQEVLPGKVGAFFIQYGYSGLNALREAFSFADSLVDQMADAVDAFFTEDIRIIAERRDGFLQGQARLPLLIEGFLELGGEENLAVCHLIGVGVTLPE